MRFVVLSSSRGTAFQAVLERIADGSLQATCIGLVTDKPDRGCVEKARMFHVPCVIVEKKKGEERAAYDARIQEAIEELDSRKPAESDPLLIAALGWMFLFGEEFVRRWNDRIVNVHPSLLPRYPGAHGLQDALADGAAETGMTIHLIDTGVDTGPILLQKTCPILPGDTFETLKDREQLLEKEWYPKVLQQIHTGELKLPA
jgi:phosphoribosylglycinamide formyltransferase-1